MENYITGEMLNKLGINLEGQDVTSLIIHLNETLEERVGAEITDALNENQLKALLDLQERTSDQEVGEWMKTNVPDFEAIIQDEIDIILGELVENTNGINAVTE